MSDLCLDASAIVAIYFDEPTAASLKATIDESDRIMVGAATVFEAILVISRRMDDDAEADVFDLLLRLRAEIIPLDEPQIRLANVARARYGKGRHPAKLNFGDCLAYAAAKSRGVRLLFVGDDFAQTDFA